MLSCIGVNIGVKLLSKFIYLVSRLACMTLKKCFCKHVDVRDKVGQ